MLAAVFRKETNIPLISIGENTKNIEGKESVDEPVARPVLLCGSYHTTRV